jgi:hypothetical protein
MTQSSEKTLVSQGQKCTDPLDYAVHPQEWGFQFATEVTKNHEG